MNVRQSVAKALQDGLFLQLFCHSTAIAVMVLGLRKLPEIATSERDVFFGVLLVMTLGLLMVLMGIMLQVMVCQQKQRAAQPQDVG